MNRVVLVCVIAACGNSSPNSQPSAVSREAALARVALAAKGPIANVKAVKWVASGTMGSDPISNTRVLVRPDKMRSDTKIGDSETTNVLDGDTAWQRLKRPGEEAVVRKLEAEKRDGFKHDLWLDADFMVLNAADPSAKLAPAPNHGELPCALLKAPNGSDVTLCFDLKTSHLVRISTLDRGEPVIVEMSDFRDVGGVKFGFARKISYPDAVVDVTYSSIELEPKLDDAYFAEPKP